MRNKLLICQGKQELKCYSGLCVLLFVWRDNKHRAEIPSHPEGWGNSQKSQLGLLDPFPHFGGFESLRSFLVTLSRLSYTPETRSSEGNCIFFSSLCLIL